MRVCLISTWNERCGIAEYACNLVNSLPEVEFVPVLPWATTTAKQAAASCDLVHINFEPGLFSAWGTGDFSTLGKPTVMTLHTSHEGDNRSHFTQGISRVVVHEETTEGFTHIPHGIPVFKEKWDPVNYTAWLGTAGFPFPWKGFTQVVQAARIMGVTAMVICPESRHADAHQMKRHLEEEYGGGVMVNINYLSEQAVIGWLSTCEVLVFAYHGNNAGISGAVRMGLATGRPLVVSPSRQFRDLRPYADEIEFAKSVDPNDIVEAVRNVRAAGKKPKRILEEMSWPVVAKKYLQVYKEVLGQ